MLILDVPPGVVTSVIFVLLDLFALTFVDIATTNIVCALHYRSIYAGIPVKIRSVDVLGLTTFLVGRRFDLANVAGLSIKLAFVTMAFFASLGIDSKLLPPDLTETRNSTFEFKITESQLDRAVSVQARNAQFEQSCRDFGSNNATFYRIIFNAREKAVDPTSAPPDSSGLLWVDKSTYFCLSKDAVVESVPVMKVTGCSKLTPGGCQDMTPYNKTLRLDRADSGDYIWQSFGTPSFGVETIKYDRRQLQEAFREYVRPELQCITLCATTKRCCTSVGQTGCTRVEQKCMMFSYDNGRTLFERWNVKPLDTGNVLLKRLYPGPIFDAEIFLSTAQLGTLLLSKDSSSNWLDFATILYREGLVYKEETTQFRQMKMRTMVPTASIALGISMLLIVALGSVVVACTIGCDERPKFNTIDGLSSIAREEVAPTMKSLKTGSPAFLALTNRSDDGLHFGVVEKAEHGISS